MAKSANDQSFVAKLNSMVHKRGVLISKALKFETFFPEEHFGEFRQAKKKKHNSLSKPTKWLQYWCNTVKWGETP